MPKWPYPDMHLKMGWPQVIFWLFVAACIFPFAKYHDGLRYHWRWEKQKTKAR